MEGFELLSTGVWSILPPLLALGLALITKEVYSSLLVGVFSGLIIYEFCLEGVGFDQLITAFTLIPQVMAEQISSNAALILFLALLGALVVIIAIAGGSRAYAEWAAKHIKSARMATVMTALLGIVVFVDDYFNCLTVGAVMRPVTDKFRISHEKLAWIIDSTAAPVCIIAPVSSWAVAMGGYMGENGFNTFVASIPYNFYALVTIVFVFAMCGFGKDFFSMGKAQRDCDAHTYSHIPPHASALETVSKAGIPSNPEAVETVITEQSDLEGATKAVEQFKGLDVSPNGKVFDLVIPIVVLIVFSITGMLYVGGFFEGVDFATAVGENPIGGLCIGAAVALVVAACMFLPRKLTTLVGFTEGASEGVRSMVGAIMILVLAWSLGGACRYMLGTGEFVSNFLTTFTCRVLSSADTDPYAAYAAAIGSLKGSKHGGANHKVLAMQKEIKENVKNWEDEDEVASYIAKIVNKQAYDHTGLIYGMGHAVYTLSDPRAVICKNFATRLAKGTEFEAELNLLKLIERLSPEVILQEKGTKKDMCANVDMYSGFVYSMMGIPQDMITPLFACSRMAGWAAHRFEELVSGKRIIRPAYKTGVKAREYKPIEER